MSIALAIALLIELPIEFPMHSLITFGCLVEAFWMSFHVFLPPFGSLLAPFGCLGRPFLDTGTNRGPCRARGAKKYEKVTIWPNFDRPWGSQFEIILVKVLSF